MTADLGNRIWGVATTNWKTYVKASCMGMFMDAGLWFDESLHIKEYYEICLRCLRENGGIVWARCLNWENSHWTDEGGCRDYQTAEMD